MKKIALILIVSTTFLLSGCAPIILGAMAGGGAYYLTTKDFKRFNYDNALTNEAMAKLKADPALKGSTHLSVAVKHSQALLIGEVSSPEQRVEAERVLQTVSGITRIYNAISVSGPISMLTQSSDSWITAKVKSDMALTKKLPSARIKVVTENGVVFLMGNVSPEQAAMAVSIARRTTGVQKVVKLFDE